jgi:hypothetical protein
MNNKINIFVILLSNLFPFYGLFFLGWNPLNVALFFWSETVIIVTFFTIEMLIRLLMGQWFVLFILLMLSGLSTFIFIHLLLSTLMFGTSGYSLDWIKMITIISNSISSIKTGLLIMSARHLLEFITFIKNKNYSQTLSKTDDGGMSIIFIRIFIMQVTIIFGGIIGKIVNNITLGVSLLILLETIYSLYFYNKQFKNQQQYGRTQ